MEALRKKKWTVRFVAEHLAYLMVFWRQMEKEKEVQEANDRSTRSATGVPKANNLKRAFSKLWLAYETPLKLYLQAEREAENMVHCTPLLCLQLTGPRAQDHIPWGKFPKFESNCPVPECGHASTMPLQSQDLIISGDERLCRAAEADGGDGRFEPLETKVGCYCFNQNCFGYESGIGCWWCVELATEKEGDVPDEIEPGVCRFDCSICKCNCQAAFEESKRNQISNGLWKNAEKGKPIKTAESKREGGWSLFFDYVKNNLDNYSVQEFQQVDSRSENEVIPDVFTNISIDVLHNTSIQCNPNFMRGLQGIIPGCCTNVEVTPVAGWKKVSISIQQARKELKGQKKSPPEVPSLEDHTPPASNFMSNAGNHAHRNGLRKVAINPCRETAAMMNGSQTAPVLQSPVQMMDSRRGCWIVFG